MSTSRERGANGRKHTRRAPTAAATAPANDAEDKQSPLRKLAEKYLRPLFRKYKIPGWLFVSYWVILTIPDIKSRLDFWTGALKHFGPTMVIIAQTLQNPIFGFIVLVTGVLYLIFAGEPKKGTLNYP